MTQAVEDWVSGRVVLAVRAATPIYVEPMTASFLLPIDVPYLSDLQALAQGEMADLLDIVPCDEDCVELCLNGTWIAESPEAEEGVFVTTMNHRVEFFLFKVWQEAQNLASVVGE
ncbi:MAG: hypothetical protein SAJ72_12935 [Jaaginema sp. PMC 1080.18]|nr:hypothetical protein [Jaaginema sp. PMC 1080.18]